MIATSIKTRARVGRSNSSITPFRLAQMNFRSAAESEESKDEEVGEKFI